MNCRHSTWSQNNRRAPQGFHSKSLRAHRISFADIFRMTWPSESVPYPVSSVVGKCEVDLVFHVVQPFRPRPHRSILPHTPHKTRALQVQVVGRLHLSFSPNMSPSGNGTSVPLDCPQCGQSFRRREHLSRHLDRHSGARAYACSICKKSFPRRCASPPFRHRFAYLLSMRAPADGLA